MGEKTNALMFRTGVLSSFLLPFFGQSTENLTFLLFSVVHMAIGVIWIPGKSLVSSWRAKDFSSFIYLSPGKFNPTLPFFCLFHGLHFQESLLNQEPRSIGSSSSFVKLPGAPTSAIGGTVLD